MTPAPDFRGSGIFPAAPLSGSWARSQCHTHPFLFLNKHVDFFKNGDIVHMPYKSLKVILEFYINFFNCDKNLPFMFKHTLQ